MPTEVYVVLAVLVVLLVGWVGWSRRAALPEVPAARPLPPGEREEEADPASRITAPDGPARERRRPPSKLEDAEDLRETLRLPPDDDDGDGEAAPARATAGHASTAAAGDGATARARAPVVHVPLPVERPRSAADDAAAAEREARRAKDRERWRHGLAKTRGGFVARLARLFRGKPRVTAELRDEIEQVLLTADIGAATADTLVRRVTEALDHQEIADPDAVWSAIRRAALSALTIEQQPAGADASVRPRVVLAIGVNGVGKTTTLGKLAARHREAGDKVLLVAGDTFRAAAVEQLDVWARQVGCDIHLGTDKADPSSVIFDGILRGRREGHDLVLCDTAGRLHTKKELMDELEKVRRAAIKAMKKDLPPAQADAITGPHDTWLVLDATIGQNALAQAKLFQESMAFTGLVVTKLDGTAKGGVVLGICDETKIPIRYVGIGEGIDDLRPFDAEAFVDALLADRDRVEPSPAATA